MPSDTVAHPHPPASAPSAWRRIAIGAAAAGAVDLAYAVASVRLAGIPAIVVPQSIASGLLGMRAFQQGGLSAALGVALHFAILVVAAGVYFLAGRRLKALADRPVLCGFGFGLVIYLFMHAIVLPLSSAPKFKSTPLSTLGDLLVHVLLVGPLIALACYAKRRGSLASDSAA